MMLCRRDIVRGLLQGFEEKRGRRVEPHSLATLEKLAGALRGIALRHPKDRWVQEALTVRRNTLVNDVKEIRRRKD
jgi:hypothetical protein